jgi:hypothetical protein
MYTGSGSGPARGPRPRQGFGRGTVPPIHSHNSQSILFLAMKTIQITLQERWAATRGVAHKSKKSYTRKNKHKGSQKGPFSYLHTRYYVLPTTEYKVPARLLFRHSFSARPPISLIVPKDTNNTLSRQLFLYIFYLW